MVFLFGLLTITTAAYGSAQRRGAVEGMDASHPNSYEPNNLDSELVPLESTLSPMQKRIIVNKWIYLHLNRDLDAASHRGDVTDVEQDSRTTNEDEEPGNHHRFLEISEATTPGINSVLTRPNGSTGNIMGIEDKEPVLSELSEIMGSKDVKTTLPYHREVDVQRVPVRTRRAHNVTEVELMRYLRSKFQTYRRKFMEIRRLVEGAIDVDRRYDCRTIYDHLQHSSLDGAGAYRGDMNHLIICNVETGIYLIDILSRKLDRQIENHRSRLSIEADFFIVCMESLDRLFKISLAMNAIMAESYQPAVKNR